MEPSTVPATEQAPKRCGGPLDGDKPWLERQGAPNPCSTLGHCHSRSETSAGAKNASVPGTTGLESTDLGHCPPRWPLDGGATSSFL